MKKLFLLSLCFCLYLIGQAQITPDQIRQQLLSHKQATNQLTTPIAGNVDIRQIAPQSSSSLRRAPQTPSTPTFTTTPSSTTVDYGHAYSYTATANMVGSLATTITAPTLPTWMTFSTDGGTKASLIGTLPSSVIGVAEDNAGNVYAITSDGSTIYKIAPDGTVSPWRSGAMIGSVLTLYIAGGYMYIPSYYGFSTSIARIPLSDPTASLETFATNTGGYALSLAEHNGYMYVADFASDKIWRVNESTGLTENVLTSVYGAFGLTFDAAGNMYIATYTGGKILKYDGTNITTVLSGFAFTSIRVDNAGNFYVSLYGGGLRKYTADFSSYKVVSLTGNEGLDSFSYSSTGGVAYCEGTNVYRLQTGPTITGTPAKSDVGDWPVKLTATNANGSTDQSFTISVVDRVGPVVTSYNTPANNATGIALQPTLSLTFDEAVTLGVTGTFSLYNGANLIKSYDLSVSADKALFTLSSDSKTLSVTLNQNLPVYTLVSVGISAGFVKDQSSNDFLGFAASSNTWKFNTLNNVAPTVTTQAVMPIGTTTATGNGNVTDLGIPNPTQHGVIWSISSNPTVSLSTKTTDGAVSVIGPFTSAITGLIPGITYHVRAYATNAANTVYGDDVTFTALKAPTVTTQAVSAITTTSATGNGNITTLGVPKPTQHGVVWGTTSNPTITSNIGITTDGAVSIPGAFTSAITDLTPGITYHVRAYATNDVNTVYGGDITFTALKAPSVTTGNADQITPISANCSGFITYLGVPKPTQYGLVWSTTGDPTITSNVGITTQGTPNTTGPFTSSITGLTPNTKYYVRAYATNTANTSYGNVITFTTPAPAIKFTSTNNGSMSFRIKFSDAGSYYVDWGHNSIPQTISASTSTTLCSTSTYIAGDTVKVYDLVIPTQGSMIEVKAYKASPYSKVKNGISSGITEFRVTDSNLTSLNVDNCPTLRTLWCDNNSLTVLNVNANPLLTTLWCNQNKLTVLDVSNNTSLNSFYCGGNLLKVLDVSNNILLTDFQFPYNQLESVDVSKNAALVSLSCNANLLTSLNLNTNLALSDLWCWGNKLTSLDVSKNTALHYFTCDDNPITSLDVTKNTLLQVLSFSRCQLTSIDISKNPALDMFWCDDNKLNYTTIPQKLKPTYTEYVYAPQSAVNATVTDVVDLSSQLKAKDINGTDQVTEYKWYSKTTNTQLVSGTDYTATNGVFTFVKTPSDSVYCTMANSAFPDLIGSNILRTVNLKVNVKTSITTQAVTNISPTTAIGNGNITDLGYPNATYGVVWSTVTSPTTTSHVKGGITVQGPAGITGAFTSYMTGLYPNTKYYVRTYATNTAGTVYGSEVSFTTPNTPEASTQAVTGITPTSAIGNGTIIDLGNPAATKYGMVWSTHEYPTTDENKTEIVGGVLGKFTAAITGLTPNTKYYVRAYATNSIGTNYGGELVSFTTLLSTGLNQTGSLNVEIYPNPTSEGIYVNAGESVAQLNLCDLSGRILLTKQLIGNTYVNISRLDNGVYIAKITCENSTVEKKIIKK